MANTFTKIASVTVGSGGAASIDFTSIPSTYTDLVVKHSNRYTSNGDASSYLRFNSDSGNNYSRKILFGDGGSAGSSQGSSLNLGYAGAVGLSTFTVNTFSSNDVYIPNYAGSTQKSWSVDGVSETNAATAYILYAANLWTSTSAITSITLLPPGGTFVQYTTATLYGISKS
jgi:hypothetical protein